YKQKFDCFPDALISGFHLMKNSDFHDNEIAEIKKLAEELDMTESQVMEITAENAKKLFKIQE
ncbi:MAG: hypothetical protein ABS871_06940, partial [Methanobrevibacter sp.]